MQPLPAIKNGYLTFGCLNNLAKYSPSMTEVWNAILKRVPNARLLLKSGGLDDSGVKRYWHDWFAGKYGTRTNPSGRLVEPR